MLSRCRVGAEQMPCRCRCAEVQCRGSRGRAGAEQVLQQRGCSRGAAAEVLQRSRCRSAAEEQVQKCCRGAGADMEVLRC